MYRKLHYWALAIGILCISPLYTLAQCTVGSLANAGAVTNNSSVAQSFTMDCPSDGFFSAITILNTSNATNVTLQIIRGSNLNGTVQYTQTGINLQLLSPTANIITLQGGAGSLAFTAGNSYIFRFIAQSPIFLSKNIGSAQLTNYPGGRLFEGNSPQQDQDLLFSVASTLVDPLPVQLSLFEASLDGEDVMLRWETESEQNNAGFEIQYSRDARKWVRIGFAEGQGTTTEKHFYKYVHPKPGAGLHYYRLLQIDHDGASQATPPRVVEGRAMAESGPWIYPNPVRNGNTLSVSGIPAGAMASGVLFSLQGRKVAGFSPGEELRLPAAVVSGMYVLEIRVDGAPSWHRLRVVD